MHRAATKSKGFFQRKYYTEILQLTSPFIAVSKTRKSLDTVYNQIYIIVCFLQFLRLILVYYAYKSEWEDYFNYDSLVNEFNRNRVFNPLAWFFASLLMPCAMYVHYKLYVNLDKFVATLGYDIIIRNQLRFFQLNRQFRLSFINDNWMSTIFQKPFAIVYEIRRVWNLVRNTQQAQFYTRLKHFPNLVTRVRIHIIFLSIFCDFFNIIFKFIYILILATGLAYHAVQFAQNFSSFRLVFMMADMFLFCYLLWTSIQKGLILLYTLMIVTYAARMQFRHLNHSLAVSANTSQLEILKRWQLYLSECTYYLRLAGQLNRLLISPVLCVFFITNIGFNVYLIITAAVKELDVVKQMLVLAVITVQGTILSLAISPLVILLSEIRRCTQHTVHFQARLRAPRQKWKLLAFYEMITAKTICELFTMGPLCKITKKIVFEV